MKRSQMRGTTATGRLTPWQLALLLVTAGSGQTSTAVNRLLTRVAAQDLWLSIFLAVPAALLGVAVLLALSRRYAGRDLGAILRRLLGPLAYPLGLGYAVLFVCNAALAAHEFVAMSHLVFTATPRAAFLLPLIGLAVYGGLSGLEVVARVNSALLLFVDIPLGILLVFLFLGQQRLVYLLPVLAKGLPPVLSGSQLVLGLFAQFVLLLVLLPLAGDRQAAGRASLWAVVLIAVIMLGHDLGPVLVFGSAAPQLTWPAFEQVKAVEAGRFIQRLDVVAIWLWVHGYWVAVGLFMHAAALTLANLFGLTSHRTLIVPLAALIFLLALAVPNQAAAMAWRWDLDAGWFLASGFGLPLVLLGLSALTTGGRRRAGQGGGVAAR